jgi:hypothetical protein
MMFMMGHKEIKKKKHTGKVGWFTSPSGFLHHGYPPSDMPCAFDNGAFLRWIPGDYIRMLIVARDRGLKPLWVVLPDVVGDARRTLRFWYTWEPIVSAFGFPLAFACQDGCEPEDVPRTASCCFIGGTTDWKLANAARFKSVTSWLHIGRVNTAGRLKWAESIGADSIDGSGWFRDGVNNPNSKRLKALHEFLSGTNEQGVLFENHNQKI